MRQAGEWGQRREAEEFRQLLSVRGIEATCREESGGRFAVWVLADDDLTRAQELLQVFAENPHSRGEEVAPSASVTSPRARIFRRNQIFDSTWGMGTPLTLTLVGLCVLIAAIRLDASLEESFHWLKYAEGFDWWGFTEIARGQVWRVITPALLHGNLLHLIFNMLWLLQLGGEIERTEGTTYLGALFVVSATLSNTAQYLVSGPNFVGMSGVVYALFGYLWAMSRWSATIRYGLPPQTSRLMFGWLLLCIFIIPGIANTAHVAGMLVGMAWGYLRSGKIKSDRRRRRFLDE